MSITKNNDIVTIQDIGGIYEVVAFNTVLCDSNPDKESAYQMARDAAEFNCCHLVELEKTIKIPVKFEQRKASK